MTVVGATGESAELEKKLASQAIKGNLLISLDNMTSDFCGDLLCQLITAPMVSIRTFGRLKDREVPNKATIFSTGTTLSRGATRLAVW
jgi:putative DNA primase/helicase